MCSYLSICLMIVSLFACPSLLQTGTSGDGLAIVAPVYRLVVEVLYNTSNQEGVNQTCGEHYAMTFLENFILTESIFHTSCAGRSDQRLTVRNAVVARVRLLGARIELSTHINISVVEPERLHHGNDATPKIPSSVGGQAWLGKNDILQCAELIDQTLLDPVSLQDDYNSEHQSRQINILQIQGNGCMRAVMEPQKFTISEEAWICPNDEDYFYDDNTWECVPRSDETASQTLPSLDFLTSTSTTTKSPIKPVVTSPEHTSNEATTPMTSPTVPPTELPVPKPWKLRLLNETGSVEINEGDEPKGITFSLTVNRTQLCGNHTACSLDVLVSFSDSEQSNPRCRTTGAVIPQLVLAEPTQGSSMEHCKLPLTVSGDDSDLYQFTRTIYLAPMLDMKYDGTQRRKLWFSVQSMVGGDSGPSEENALSLPIYIKDGDRKATCKSINDPHITTFDGLEYNNFYDGEFILYQHTSLPYKVHAIYQRCSPGVKASCNCAVAVQSGDDVIVIDRCFRNKKPFNRLFGKSRPFTKMTVDLFMNGDLTPGTYLNEEADGKKYVIYLPHGAYVKVMVSGDLINVWIVASPKDAFHTSGLCGNNDKERNNDLQKKDGSLLRYNRLPHGDRPQPHEFCLDWRVELYGVDSIFRGVPGKPHLEPPLQYCDCMAGRQHCGYAVDISTCDVKKGDDVTDWLVSHAKDPILNTPRRKRDVNDNAIGIIPDEPITIDTDFVPPDHSWDNSDWNFVSAQDFCNNYVRDKYRVGQLCTQISAVNFNQEIDTCIEDIQITWNTSWADSARDAMKEQCLEEVQRNGSLSSDIANAIQNAICINDCSGHGQCINGSCKCDANWYTADCSLTMWRPPYSSEISANGLCDTRFMSCDRVIVYGDHFIDNENLTCHLQKTTKITEDPYQFKALPEIEKTKALFINFNAVECPLKERRPYLVSVSNDGIFDHASDALLFLPFDSACYTCSTNSTSCTRRLNSCRIDGKCYLENERSANDPCLICKPFADELQWTTDADSTCRPSWWEDIEIPNWVIAVAAAVGGSLIGVLIGFLLYKCCCKQRKTQKEEHSDNGHDSGVEESDTPPCEDHLLHRNRGVPSFMDDRFLDIAFRSPEVEQTYFHSNNNRRVQNGVDSTTYF